jgi:hypothetical protein
MSNPVMLSTLVKSREKIEEEKDRYPLAAGIRFVISDFSFIASEKYTEFAKINGYDLVTKQPLKYRTTAKSVIEQLHDIEMAAGRDETGKLKQEVKVFVGMFKSKAGNNGLVLEDAA